ncbi:MAG: PEP-CTERM sorting domain-containing protein [Pseudomonadota bacterium]
MNTQKLVLKAGLIATTVGLLLAGNAMAAVTNGSFAGNSLNGWSTLGDVTTASGGAFLTTASLDFQDDFAEDAGTFNASGTSAYDIALGGFEAFAGLNAGALDTDSEFVFEGSLLKQTFTVNAGDTLSFNWNMFTNEGANQDFAFVAVNGALTKLAQSSNALTPSVPYALSTGASFFSQTFATASSVTLAFGIVDVNDYNETSALWFDNVQLTAAVPEPETYAMLLAGLGFIVASSRRKNA